MFCKDCEFCDKREFKDDTGGNRVRSPKKWLCRSRPKDNPMTGESTFEKCKKIQSRHDNRCPGKVEVKS